MERALGLICGAGVLPARMAEEARRQGWRVVAFAYADASVVAAHADRTVPSRLTDPQAVLDVLREEGVTTAVFGGAFRLEEVLRGNHGPAEGAYARAVRDARSLGGVDLFALVTATLEGMGIEVLDQRTFLGPAIAAPACWSRRTPSEEEWGDVRQGLRLARWLAARGVGQTVVLRRGVVTAVEAVEGTTVAIRRGVELAGPGSVVVKAVAPDHDHRFDTPAIGPESVRVAAEGGAAVVAVEARHVLIVDHEATVALADASDVALVAVEEPAA